MTESLHPLLLRQLRREGITPEAAGDVHDSLPRLIQRISRAYAEADQDRYVLERSQEVASREMAQLYADLKSSQARLASLVSLSSDWVWEQDAGMIFRYVSEHDNQQGFELSGLLVGKHAEPDASVVSQEDADEFRQRVAARQSFRNLTFSLPQPDGRTFYFRISGEPVFENDVFCGYRGVGSDVTLATLAEQRVLQLARYDSLTGLANRSMFVAQLELSLVRARATGRGLAVLFIDLDRFKTVNDSLGHDAGDTLLKAMAQRLTKTARGSDTVARLGGDEFVLLVDGVADEAALSAVARRILAVLGEPVDLGGRGAQLSASVGVAVYPEHGTDVATLLKSADSAMYLAKSRGKNNFQFFTAQIAHRAASAFALEVDLREAVQRGEMRLHYQPRYNVATGKMCGMEALLRWQHPQRGLLAPGEFIEMAEETGLIIPIGRWVMLEACGQIRAWRRAGLAPARCSVNLSARQFCNESLVDEVRAALKQAALEPAALEIELTESMLMADPARAQQVLERLHALGVSIAIDDFGTGHSSLAYLKRFPAKTLKIDRSFVKGLPDDRDDAAITQAVIALAHSLDMQVVAEGVETPEQLEYLRQHGCEEAQGYLLARPMPAGQLADLLELAMCQAQSVGLAARPESADAT